ncbi:MAG: hypothetical protein NT105_19065 [Verrucomicrobia bacterium]|nr:hypothetical protein [Verrucomicrobiota bacterium]
MSHSNRKPPKTPTKPDATKTAPTGEIVSASVEDDAFTGERLREKEPRLYETIVRILKNGGGVRLTARLARCSPHTIMAIGRANGISNKEMKAATAATLREFARLGAERLLESYEELPLSQLALSVAIATDKASVLEGFASLIIEHRSLTVDRAEAARRLDAALEIPGVIVESTPLPLPGSKTTDTGTATAQNR